MVKKILNGPWPAKMAPREKLQALCVEILARYPSLGHTKGQSNQHRSNRSPRPHGLKFPGADIESLDGQLKPYVDSSSDGWDKAIEIIHFGLNESCQEYARILKQQFIL